MSQGIPGPDLSAADLDRELAHLHEKRHDVFVHGSAEQWRNHVTRTRELEDAYLARFSTDVTDASEKRTSA